MSVLVFQTYETVVIRAWPSSEATPPPQGRGPCWDKPPLFSEGLGFGVGAGCPGGGVGSTLSNLMPFCPWSLDLDRHDLLVMFRNQMPLTQSSDIPGFVSWCHTPPRIASFRMTYNHLKQLHWLDFI